MYTLTVLLVTVGITTGKGGYFDTPKATGVRGQGFFGDTMVITRRGASTTPSTGLVITTGKGGQLDTPRAMGVRGQGFLVVRQE